MKTPEPVPFDVRVRTRWCSYDLCPDILQTIIPRIRMDTLEGCHVLFSSVIPLDTRPEATEVWKTAHAFGAKCYTELSGRITHVVAAKVIFPRSSSR